MKKCEYGFYGVVDNWDFSAIKRTKEELTDWDMLTIIKKHAKKGSKILDLGTGGGEKVVKYYPEVAEILVTDFSDAMVETAQKNLAESGRRNISFRKMDNLKMDTPDEYFDIVSARHTCTDPVQIYKTLKPGGVLVLRGVDQLDCWELKRMFGYGQAYHDKKAISQIDYEAVLGAGFVDVELVPIHVREYYHTVDDFMALLHRTPILKDFSEEPDGDESQFEFDAETLEKYISGHKTDKGILLIRRYYGITARKPEA